MLITKKKSNIIFNSKTMETPLQKLAAFRKKADGYWSKAYQVDKSEMHAILLQELEWLNTIVSDVALDPKQSVSKELYFEVLREVKVVYEFMLNNAKDLS